MTSSPWEFLTSLGIHFYGLNDEKLLPGNKVCKPTVKLPCVIEEDPESGREDIICNSFGCNTTLSSISELEVHQRARHTHVCVTCHAILPSHHLLDRHILEVHDSFFQISAQEKPMYACLLEFCTEVFQTPHGRKEHCVKVHKFPPDFRFNLQWRKLKPQKGNAKNPTTKEKNNCIVNDEYTSQAGTTESRLLLNPDEMECSNNGDCKGLSKDTKKSQVAVGRKVPKSISFGMGIPRGFVIKRGKKGKHWHQRDKVEGTRTHLDQISMSDINQVLEEMES